MAFNNTLATLGLMKKTIAVFDFDGTITRKDTLLEFIKFSKGRFRFYFCFLRFSPLLIAMKMGILPNWKVKQLIFAHLYRGMSIKKFNEWCFGFCAIIDDLLYPKAIECLCAHRNRGEKIVIVSASIENWIKPWADKNGIDTVLATKIECDENGRIVGNFLTKNCYGQEKVNRLLEILPDRDDYKIVAYGDSAGDRELLAIADEGFYRVFS